MPSRVREVLSLKRACYLALLFVLAGCAVQLPEPEPQESPGQQSEDVLVDAVPAGPSERPVPVYTEDREEGEKPVKPSPKVVAEPVEDQLTDEELLDLVQRQTFKYFWDFAHPVSGMAREISEDNDRVTIGGSGFGVMAIIVGVHRGYITRDEAVAHLTKMATFLRDKADRYHGVWPHWLNGTTGKTIRFSKKDDGGDIVETAFMIQGLLAARQYFSRNNGAESNLRSIITRLWWDVEWDWYARGTDRIRWHWSPTHEWEMGLDVVGYNECQIVYFLAVASPTHAVPLSCYYKGWAAGNYEKQLNIQWPDRLGGPLFLVHYSYLGMSPHFSDDFIEKTSFRSYSEFAREYTLLNRRYCVSRKNVYPHYGDNCWGLTSSADPERGYMGHEPSPNRDNGTISPTAAISSIVYTPEESISAMRHFYEVHGPEGLWGPYGFRDAFNVERDWIADKYIAIDQGPIVVMIENYRSQLLWRSFMKDPDIYRMTQNLRLKARPPEG